jgi:hypothetical protein
MSWLGEWVLGLPHNGSAHQLQRDLPPGGMLYFV